MASYPPSDLPTFQNIARLVGLYMRFHNEKKQINAKAVAANCKHSDHNTIELNHSKVSGDITIPTNCLLLSTNCVDIIKESIKVDVVDSETGEVS